MDSLKMVRKHLKKRAIKKPPQKQHTTKEQGKETKPIEEQRKGRKGASVILSKGPC